VHDPFASTVGVPLRHLRSGFIAAPTQEERTGPRRAYLEKQKRRETTGPEIKDFLRLQGSPAALGQRLLENSGLVGLGQGLLDKDGVHHPNLPGEGGLISPAPRRDSSVPPSQEKLPVPPLSAIPLSLTDGISIEGIKALERERASQPRSPPVSPPVPPPRVAFPDPPASPLDLETTCLEEPRPTPTPLPCPEQDGGLQKRVREALIVQEMEALRRQYAGLEETRIELQRTKESLSKSQLCEGQLRAAAVARGIEQDGLKAALRKATRQCGDLKERLRTAEAANQDLLALAQQSADLPATELELTPSLPEPEPEQDSLPPRWSESGPRGAEAKVALMEDELMEAQRAKLALRYTTQESLKASEKQHARVHQAQMEREAEEGRDRLERELAEGGRTGTSGTDEARDRSGACGEPVALVQPTPEAGADRELGQRLEAMSRDELIAELTTLRQPSSQASDAPIPLLQVNRFDARLDAKGEAVLRRFCSHCKWRLVRCRGSQLSHLARSTMCQPGLRYARDNAAVIEELLRSEETYVATLHEILCLFLCPIRDMMLGVCEKEIWVTPSERDNFCVLLSACEEICMHHTLYLDIIHATVAREGPLGDLSSIFIRIASGIEKTYPAYLNRLTRFMQTADVLLQDPTFYGVLCTQSAASGLAPGLGMYGFLIQPLQRFAVYGTVCERLCRQTAMEDSETRRDMSHSLEALRLAQSAIDDQQAEFRRLEAMQELLRTDFDYVTEGRSLVRETPALLVHTPETRHGGRAESSLRLVLLSDHLLVTKPIASTTDPNGYAHQRVAGGALYIVAFEASLLDVRVREPPRVEHAMNRDPHAASMLVLSFWPLPQEPEEEGEIDAALSGAGERLHLEELTLRFPGGQEDKEEWQRVLARLQDRVAEVAEAAPLSPPVLEVPFEALIHGTETTPWPREDYSLTDARQREASSKLCATQADLEPPEPPSRG